MKKFPISDIKIGGHIWKVKLTPFTSKKYKAKVRGSRCKNNNRTETFMFGLTSWWDATIRINSRLPKNSQVETLIHEILHVMLDEVKGSCKMKRADEEILVQALRFLLHGLFLDNPKFVEYISEE